MTRVVKDKGGWRTEPHVQIDLDKARRETRARIDGTEQFHVDPYARPLAPTPDPEPAEICFCAFLGNECEICRNA